MEILSDYTLKEHNSLAIAAKADWWINYSSPQDLKLLARDEFFLSQPFLSIGGGNNVLFLEDFKGILLHNTNTDWQEVARDEDSVLLRLGGGIVWDEFVAKSLQMGFYGLENLSLIPGTVAASAVQNIGAYGAEARAFVHSVEAVDVLTGQDIKLSNRECRFAYRYSTFKEPEHRSWVITHVTYKLHTTPKPNLSYASLQSAFAADEEVTPAAIRDKVIAIRESKLPDPKVLPNAGSFFMNPVLPIDEFNAFIARYPNVPNYPAELPGFRKLAAGKLIEECGFKQQQTGKVGVYEKQALIVVNRAAATGAEVAAFAREVIGAVQEKYGVTLHPEVIFVGAEGVRHNV